MIYFAELYIASFKSKKAKESVPIYFVKIGQSKDPWKRMSNLEAAYNAKSRMLAIMPGGPKEEQRIHQRFDHLRFGGPWRKHRVEWFYPGADLMKFIMGKMSYGS